MIRKRAEYQGTITGWIIVLLVLTLVLIFIFRQPVFGWIKNLPGHAQPDDNETSLSCDELKRLSYEKVGKVVFEERGWDFVNHYYIYIDLKKPISASACASTLKGVCMVNNCPDNTIKESECSSKGGNWIDGCFDANNRLIYNKDKIATPLYIRWETDNPGNGKIVFSKFGPNIVIGSFDKNFIQINGDEYVKVKSKLEEEGITEEMMLKLNGAKYLGDGGIYRSYLKPLGAFSSWQRTLNDYQTKKCTLDESSCIVKNSPCECFSQTQFENRIAPSTCNAGEYCFEYGEGCSSQGVDTLTRLSSCITILSKRGITFKQAKICDLDSSSCKVTNSPCTCPFSGNLDDSGKIKTNILGISTCSENQYCYYGERGCSDVAPISQELLGVCKASLEKTGKTFNQAEDCSIDITNCKVTNSPCYCVNNAGTKALCSQNQYCYYREMGCQEFGP